jgi:hypothetical protein
VVKQRCLKLLDQRREAKLQWLQDPSEINGNILNNIRREASSISGKKRVSKREINELETYSKNKAKIGASEARTGGSQQPGHASGPNPGETSIETSKRQGQRAVPLLRWPENQKGPGTLGDQGLIRGL